MNSLKAYGSDSSSSDDDSDNENDEHKKLREAEMSYHLKTYCLELIYWEFRAWKEEVKYQSSVPYPLVQRADIGMLKVLLTPTFHNIHTCNGRLLAGRTFSTPILPTV